jgi:hypothetical protein
VSIGLRRVSLLITDTKTNDAMADKYTQKNLGRSTCRRAFDRILLTYLIETYSFRSDWIHGQMRCESCSRVTCKCKSYYSDVHITKYIYCSAETRPRGCDRRVIVLNSSSIDIFSANNLQCADVSTNAHLLLYTIYIDNTNACNAHPAGKQARAFGVERPI